MVVDIYQVDAFANKLFEGNPAAVVLLSQWPTDELMQQIAQENNLSETAFAVITPKAEADYHLRWFTPGGEIDLCGHATLATAYVVKHHTNFSKHSLTFSTKVAGNLTVNLLDEDYFQLNFPSYVLDIQPNMTDVLVRCLGVRATSIKEVLLGRDLMVVLQHESDVEQLIVDFNSMLDLPGKGVIVSAAGSKFDVVSRCFYPKLQVDEDPVTGSAHCHIIPYFTQKLQKTALICFQASKRTGILYGTVLPNNRVGIKGKVVPYLQGKIHLQ